MPAQSQQQQKLFGLALSVKRGETPRSEASKEVLDIVDSMTEKEIEDFASTSHSGLPSKVESQLRDAVREIMRERVLSESVNEAISRDAAYIHGILQTGQDAAQNFIDDNGLDGEKLSDYVKANRNNIDGYNVKHYISGERGTVGSVPKLRQAFIKKFKKGKSVNEAKAIGKKIFSDAKGKLFFGYQNDDDTVQLVDYKTWKKLPMKDLSNEFMANRIINSIVRNERQFNKKVEYNMWSKKTNPSFEDRMDYFIKNNWISNITKTGIKESVESVNEENEPTNPELWDRAIAAAKREYDVYPSAYANAFASKWYKDKGGDWKTKKESVNEVQVADFKIGDFIHLTRLNKTGMVTKISGNKVTIRTPQRFITGDIKDVEVLYQDGVIPSVTEAGPGLWANIRAKQARGEAPARKGSKAYKSAVAAGNKINKAESVNEGNSSVEIGDIIFFPPTNSAATVIDRFGRSVTLKLANGKKVKTVVDKVKLLAQDGVNEHKDCGCGCGGVTEGGCGTSLTERQLNEWKAEEVLQQLGGRKFIAMTGANNFVKDDKAKSIIFKLPRAKSGIKYVRITLTSMDVYNIEFISVRGSNIKTVATAKGVYNDELQSVFTQYTGLYTSL